MKRIFTISFVLFLSSVFAQEDANWRYLRPSNTGIPGDYVTTIASDTCDNLWVGGHITFWEEGGVGEFDGQNWKNWTNFEGHLPSARVKTIYFDKLNHVWVGTDSGLAHYDRDTTWQIWTENNSILPGDYIYGIAADNQNNVWVSFSELLGGPGGIAKWDGTNWTVFTPSNSNLQTTDVYQIEFDSQGILWIATPIGLIKFDGSTFYRYHSGNSGLLGNTIAGFRFDDNGLMWILNSGGLNTFDGSNWSTFPIVVPDTDYSGFDIHDGQIAIGILATTPGVSHYDGSTWNFYPASNHLYDVHFDNNGTLWVCGIGYLGQQISGSNWKVFRRYNSGLADYMINDIFIDKQDRKWFASGNGGHSFFNDTKWRTFGKHNNGFEPYPFPLTSIGSATAQDTAGNIWIAVYGTSDGIARWNEDLNIFDIIYNESNTGMWMQSINTLVIDSANRIWAGSHGYGVYMYDGNQWQWIKASNSALASDYILKLYVDYDGNVWAGTQSGVVKFENGGSTSTFYETANSGLLNDFVFEIVQQANGIMWFGTGAGVNKFDGTTWTSYTEADGVAGRVVQGLAYDEANQLLYVGAYEVYYWPYYGGISVFDGTNWTSFLQGSSPIAHKQVEDLELDQYGNLWIMTQTMGVTVYNPNGVVGLDEPNSSCPTWTVITGINSLSDTNDLIVSGYPNPVNDIYSLNINLNEKSEIKIKLFDLTGRLQYEYHYSGLQAGSYIHNINLNQFSSGIYLLKISSDEDEQSIKLIKQ